MWLRMNDRVMHPARDFFPRHPALAAPIALGVGTVITCVCELSGYRCMKYEIEEVGRSERERRGAGAGRRAT